MLPPPQPPPLMAGNQAVSPGSASQGQSGFERGKGGPNHASRILVCQGKGGSSGLCSTPRIAAAGVSAKPANWMLSLTAAAAVLQL